MLETKEQKEVFYGSIALIIVLVVVSVFHKPSLTVQKKPDKKQLASDFVNSQAYLDYYKAANVDQQASQDLFETVLTKEDIKREVESALNVNQPIAPPAIDQKKLKISPRGDSQAVSDYLAATFTEVRNFNSEVPLLSQSMFEGDIDSGQLLKNRLKNLTDKLYSSEVPKEAVSLHKSLLTSFVAYGDLINETDSFNSEELAKNDHFWPELYKNYVVINDSVKSYSSELVKLTDKHKITFIEIKNYAEAGGQADSGFSLVPKAHAFLGGFTITIGDIPRIIMDAIKEGVRNAFLHFLGAMLGKFITKLEQSYAIANFLHYSDALVTGQYANDFLDKYVSDPFDRSVAKTLLPQFNCGKNPDLKNIFRAQAQNNLGFDPYNLDYSDPQYYQKMSRVGNFMASPSGWEVYYNDLAAQTESEAQKAIEREFTSSGLKTPRDLSKLGISGSVNGIISAQRAAFNSLLSFGQNNAESLISGVVGKLTEQLVTKFVFQGVTNNGNISVLKEQKTCASAGLVNPIIPVPPTQYQQPQPPNENAIIVEQCSKTSTVSDDCTLAIVNELGVCANNPSQHQGNLSCAELANSNYVNALISACPGLQPTSANIQMCANLQSYLQKLGKSVTVGQPGSWEPQCPNGGGFSSLSTAQPFNNQTETTLVIGADTSAMPSFGSFKVLLGNSAYTFQYAGNNTSQGILSGVTGPSSIPQGSTIYNENLKPYPICQ